MKTLNEMNIVCAFVFVYMNIEQWVKVGFKICNFVPTQHSNKKKEEEDGIKYISFQALGVLQHDSEWKIQ